LLIIVHGAGTFSLDLACIARNHCGGEPDRHCDLRLAAVWQHSDALGNQLGQSIEKGFSMAQLILPLSRRDHVKGPRSAPVTLVEYGDYECPYCGLAYSFVKDLEQSLGD